MGWVTEKLELDSWREQEISLFSTASRLAPGPTQVPTQRLTKTLFMGIKWLGR